MKIDLIMISKILILFQLIGCTIAQPISVPMGNHRFSVDLPLQPTTPNPRCDNNINACSFTISVPNLFSKIIMYTYNNDDSERGDDLRVEIRNRLINDWEVLQRTIVISPKYIDNCNGYLGSGYSKLDLNERFSIIAFWKNDFIKCIIISNFPDAWMNKIAESASITGEEP